MKKNKAFVLVEILIASVIIVSSIAASLYLMRVGLNYMYKMEINNKVVSIMPLILNYFEAITLEDLNGGSGIFKLDSDILVKWESKLISSKRPERDIFGDKLLSIYEFYLYDINIRILFKDIVETKKIKIIKYDRKISKIEE